MKKDVKLFNALFPFWMLKYIAPIMWGVVAIGNFLIDSLVLFIAILVLRIEPKWNFYKANIFKIFIFGLLADIIGSSIMFALSSFFNVGRMGDEWYLTLPALVISGICIFILNYLITFRKSDKNL